MFSFLKNLFSKETRGVKANCYICNSNIYEGEVYGHDNEPGNLLLGGYYFCASCVGKQSMNRVNQSALGQIVMMSDGQQRYRVTVRQ